MEEHFLQNLFALLIKNKAFPNYQAERRIDIFINYFLERILSEYLKDKTRFICPEFPIKKEGSTNLSTKLDYLCCTDKEIVFVELKTDASSLSKEQADIYLNCNWAKCMKELDLIKDAATKLHREKYNKALIPIINGLEFTIDDPPIKLVYISPLPSQNSSFLQPPSFRNLSELPVQVSNDERIPWEFIKDLGLCIFEVKK